MPRGCRQGYRTGEWGIMIAEMDSETGPQAFPDYTVRVSPRARHPRLRISPSDGLVVVIPQDFDRRRIPEMLAARRPWWQKHLRRLQAHCRHIAAEAGIPGTIAMDAVGERWSVAYVAAQGAREGAYEGDGYRLTVKGRPDDHPACRAVLRRWLARKAYRHFEPWLQQVARDGELAYQRLIVRGQKTRWGSCSRRKTISLNYKLLFFPPRLVRYVLIHELCHTRVMNHSAEYWRTVAALEPGYRSLHEEMREAWRFVPGWVMTP